MRIYREKYRNCDELSGGLTKHASFEPICQ
jgi:hypothetical protein